MAHHGGRRSRARAQTIAFILSIVATVVPAAPAGAALGVTFSLYDLPGDAFRSGDRVVALTFDDGPSGAITPRVLDLLRDRGVPATFFPLGSMASARPDLVTREANDGHTVGAHSWSHADLTSATSTYPHEIDDSVRLVAGLTQHRVQYFRPPYGRVSATLLHALAARDLTAVLWNVDPGDSKGRTTLEIARGAVSAARPGSIIILHDGPGHDATVGALPTIIDGIRGKGLNFVALPLGPRIHTGERLLRDSNTSGVADVALTYGTEGDVQLACDWNGDGIDTPGVFRAGAWYLRESNTSGPGDEVVQYGDPFDVPVCGDWNGDGIDTVGVFRDGVWYVRETNTTGTADHVFGFGDPGDEPLVGRWVRDGPVSVGVHRGTTFFLAPGGGVPVLEFVYGDPGDRPVVGDWDGDGVTTIGVCRGSLWLLRNANSPGLADVAFVYGDPPDDPLTGDWNGDGVDTVGVTR